MFSWRHDGRKFECQIQELESLHLMVEASNLRCLLLPNPNNSVKTYPNIKIIPREWIDDIFCCSYYLPLRLDVELVPKLDFR